MKGIKALAIEALCAQRDQAFVRFDYRGHGESSGRFEDCVIGTWLDDSLAVFDQLTEGPQILVGSSMGAWLALLVALQRPGRVHGLVTVAAAPDFTEELIWARLGEDQRKYLLDDGVLRVPSAYSPDGYLITRRLIEEGRRHLLLQKPIRFERPVRILHGMADADVPWQHSMKLASALTGADIVVTLVKSGDHRLSRPSNIELIRDAICSL